MATGENATAIDDEHATIRDAEARTFVREGVGRVTDLVRSSYGPRGLETVVEIDDGTGERELLCTTVGNEILDAVERGDGFVHPVAALLVDSVDAMQRGLGDGSITALVLADELVRRGLSLIDEGVDPTSVVVGYAMATHRAGAVLDDLARPVEPTDRETLAAVAETTMTGDLAPDHRRAYADAVAEAVVGVARASSDWLNTDDIKIVAGTTDGEPMVREGVVLRRKIGPDREVNLDASDLSYAVTESRTDVTVAVIDQEIDFEKTATNFGGSGSADVTVESPRALGEYRSGRDRRVRDVATGLADLGVDVLVSQPLVDGSVKEAFWRAGVRVLDYVETPRADVHRIARATGATVVSTVEDVNAAALGRAGSFVERQIDGDAWAIFDDCDGGVRTVELPARLHTRAAEHERLVRSAVETAARAAMDGQVLPGAGAPMVALTTDLSRYARTVAGKEQLAIEAVADGMGALVRTLARNAGLDPTATLASLRRAHNDGRASFGFDVDSGAPLDAWDAGIVEPRRVFSQAVETAVAATEPLLTVDAVLHPDVDWESYRPETEHR